MNYDDLKLTKKEESITLNFNGVEIDVKQYVPLMDKYYIAQGIINSSLEENGRVVNYFKKDMAYVYDIINAYTNLDLTAAETLEETAERYDNILTSGLFDEILKNIPEQEINIINTYIENGLLELQKYQTSPVIAFADLVTIIKDSLEQLSTIAPEDYAKLNKLGEELQKQSIGENNDAQTDAASVDENNK